MLKKKKSIKKKVKVVKTKKKIASKKKTQQKKRKLFKKNNTGLRLPAFIGIFIGYIFDILKYVSGINLPISSIRVKKFLKTKN